jgi:hypothetical protein
MRSTNASARPDLPPWISSSAHGERGWPSRVHDVGVHLQDLDAVRDHIFGIGGKHDELVGVHHQPDVLVGRTGARFRQRARQWGDAFAADILVQKREDRRRDAVERNTLAFAKAQGRVEGLDVVAVDFVEQLALGRRRGLEQPFARDRAVTDLF